MENEGRRGRNTASESCTGMMRLFDAPLYLPRPLISPVSPPMPVFFFLKDPPPPEFSPLPLHAPLPIGAAQRKLRAAVPLSVKDSTCRIIFGKCVARKCASTSARLASLSASGRFRQVYSVFQLWSSIHLDRKSTRLNSSHSQISYAVFCL